jgi:hypothetical protein
VIGYFVLLLWQNFDKIYLMLTEVQAVEFYVEWGTMRSYKDKEKHFYDFL